MHATLEWVKQHFPYNRQRVYVVGMSMGGYGTIDYCSAYPDSVAAAMALCDTSVSIEDPRLAEEEQLAIVLGTEGDGLSPHTIAACDYTVRIPMAHQVDSLNVAAASAVAFWQLRAR